MACGHRARRLRPNGVVAGHALLQLAFGRHSRRADPPLSHPTVTYDNPTGHTLREAAMGSVAGLFVPDRSARWPGVNVDDAVYRQDLATTLAPSDMSHMEMSPKGAPVSRHAARPPAGSYGARYLANGWK